MYQETITIISVRISSAEPNNFQQRLPDVEKLFTDELPLSRVLGDLPEAFTREGPDSDQLWRFSLYTRLYVKHVMEERKTLEKDCISALT